ncbi:hypothetical protein QBC43DRAFT_355053 [Cladorrhinum sp. PSN259]|nr:hypothetical protein QBC43DRAFT_355053 [Cladorrhinum sp. PSN259]
MGLSFPVRSEAPRSINEEKRAKLYLDPNVEVEDHPTSIDIPEFKHGHHIRHDAACQQTQDHIPSPSYSPSPSRAPTPGPQAFEATPTIKTPPSELPNPEHHHHNHCGNNHCGYDHSTSSRLIPDRRGDADNFPAHIGCHGISDEGLRNLVENNMPPNESMYGLMTYLSHYLQDLTCCSVSLDQRVYQLDLTLQEILAVLLANYDLSAASASKKKKKDSSNNKSAASGTRSKTKNDIPGKERKDVHASFAKKLSKLLEHLERERERGFERQEEQLRLLLRSAKDGSYTIGLGGEGRRKRLNNELATANGARRQYVIVNGMGGAGNMTGGCPLASVTREPFQCFVMMVAVFCLGVVVPGLRTGPA